MTSISPTELQERLAAALGSNGWTWQVADAGKPIVGTVTSPGGEQVILRVFIQNISHGGGSARPAEEFRIQISNVPPLEDDPAGQRRLLLGWSEDVGVFAAFDPTRHVKPGASPSSVQIAQDTLERAQGLGYATQRKGDEEIALAFGPERLAPYAFAAASIHEEVEAPHPQDAEAWSSVEAAARPAHASAQGFQHDQMIKVAIELHAMQVATDHLVGLGWSVTDVSAVAPYDLHCTRDGEELRVEVKGTQGLGAQVIITANELGHARANHPLVSLIVVSGIVVEGDQRIASGGTLRQFDEWNPTDEDLHAISYYCTVPSE